MTATMPAFAGAAAFGALDCSHLLRSEPGLQPKLAFPLGGEPAEVCLVEHAHQPDGKSDSFSRASWAMS